MHRQCNACPLQVFHLLFHTIAVHTAVLQTPHRSTSAWHGSGFTSRSQTVHGRKCGRLNSMLTTELNFSTVSVLYASVMKSARRLPLARRTSVWWGAHAARFPGLQARRVGDYSLHCMNCHQVLIKAHAATRCDYVTTLAVLLISNGRREIWKKTNKCQRAFALLKYFCPTTQLRQLGSDFKFMSVCMLVCPVVSVQFLLT